MSEERSTEDVEDVVPVISEEIGMKVCVSPNYYQDYGEQGDCAEGFCVGDRYFWRFASAGGGWRCGDVYPNVLVVKTVEEIRGEEEWKGGYSGEEGEIEDLWDVEGRLMGGFIAEGYGKVVPDDEDSKGEDDQEVWEGGGD